jgi:hypothetical protein
MHGVLKHWHPMVGIDFHIPWPPGSPSPAPSPVPYKTGMLLIGPTTLTAELIPNHLTDSFSMCLGKGTDIGPMIPHIGPPSVTLPIEMVFSASKSHFASSRYVAAGKPVAVALAAFVNPNLNCGTPVPTPTGEVLALTTHWVEMSWADILGGLGAMLSDFLIQSALNKLGSALGNRLSKFLQPRLFARFNYKWLTKVIGESGDFALLEAWAGVKAAGQAELVSNWAGTGVSTVFGFLVGGPMGADIGTVGGYDGEGTTPGGLAEDVGGGFVENQSRALGGYLDGPGAANH